MLVNALENGRLDPTQMPSLPSNIWLKIHLKSNNGSMTWVQIHFKIDSKPRQKRRHSTSFLTQFGRRVCFVLMIAPADRILGQARRIRDCAAHLFTSLLSAWIVLDDLRFRFELHLFSLLGTRASLDMAGDHFCFLGSPGAQRMLLAFLNKLNLAGHY